MRIAVIGGIGSGKSEVMKIAKERGFFCLSADEINAELLKTPSYIQKIATLFPSAVANGVVDKGALAKIVFSDQNERKKLNSLAHPEIMRVISECKESPLAVELPLFIEGGDEAFDEIVYVRAPLFKRIARLKKGRGMSVKQAISRIRSQVPSAVLRAKATMIVDNSTSFAVLKRNANEVFDKIQKAYLKTELEPQGGDRSERRA